MRSQPIPRRVAAARELTSPTQVMHIEAAVAQAACWGVPLEVLLDGVDR
jgi:hypothetical protein